MKYYLIHNMEEMSKKKIIDGYQEEGYTIVFQTDKDVLMKKSEKEIQEEEKYWKVTQSFLKRNSMILNSQGKVINLTEAFEYAFKQNGFKLMENKFEWYLRNIIIREIMNS